MLRASANVREPVVNTTIGSCIGSVSSFRDVLDDCRSHLNHCPALDVVLRSASLSRFHLEKLFVLCFGSASLDIWPSFISYHFLYWWLARFRTRSGLRLATGVLVIRNRFDWLFCRFLGLSARSGGDGRSGHQIRRAPMRFFAICVKCRSHFLVNRLVICWRCLHVLGAFFTGLDWKSGELPLA